MAESNLFRTGVSVRLLSPSEMTENKWVAEDYRSRRRFAVSPIGAALLVALMKPTSRTDLLKEFSSSLQVSSTVLDSMIDSLLELALVEPHPSVDTGHDADYRNWFLDLQEQWSRWGWSEAAEYHLATYDYEFLGADDLGRLETHNRMIEYATHDPDINRAKHYSVTLDRLSLDAPDGSQAPLPFLDAIIGENEAADGKTNTTPVTVETVTAILSLTFGRIGKIGLHWNGSPILRRTSPSGGGRHPTEAYLLALDVPRLRAGWYHYAFDTYELELLSTDESTPEGAKHYFPATYGRAPFPVCAIIFMTSVFERNMFRYREPRTFRTIHIDSGHLCETLELVAKANGVRAFTQYLNNEHAIEQKLGVSFLEEGCLLATAIG